MKVGIFAWWGRGMGDIGECEHIMFGPGLLRYLCNGTRCDRCKIRTVVHSSPIRSGKMFKKNVSFTLKHGRGERLQQAINYLY